MKRTYLVTGGAGYIGSHTTLALLEQGAQVVVLDNLSNSHAESLNRLSRLAGRAPIFVKGDVRDRPCLARVFAGWPIDAVLHFAGLKAVGDSVRDPGAYYDNNVAGTLALCNAMAQAGVFRLVFSSSATVYGVPKSVPIAEHMAQGEATNPYGRTKQVAEGLLRDFARADSRWRIALLRYFNPVGAHESGAIGEDPRGTPSNLMPYIAQVAAGHLPELPVYGRDYDTPDGTGVRDYIHVADLAQGHLHALRALDTRRGAHVWNLGTGKGYGVLEVVHEFEQVCGHAIPYRFEARRPGDVAACWADPSRAQRELGWQARRGLREMVRDAWHWQCQNPHGYRGTAAVAVLG